MNDYVDIPDGAWLRPWPPEPDRRPEMSRDEGKTWEPLPDSCRIIVDDNGDIRVAMTARPPK